MIVWIEMSLRTIIDYHAPFDRGLNMRYWPSLFSQDGGVLTKLFLKMQKEKEYPAMTEQAWPIEDLLIWGFTVNINDAQ